MAELVETLVGLAVMLALALYATVRFTRADAMREAPEDPVAEGGAVPAPRQGDC